jgi:endoglucanase
MASPRPFYAVSSIDPGADVLGAVAAALAAASQVFVVNAAYQPYGGICLQQATTLYDLAKLRLGTAQYPASTFYPSNGFYDDLAFAALWLAKANLVRALAMDA